MAMLDYLKLFEGTNEERAGFFLDQLEKIGDIRIENSDQKQLMLRCDQKQELLLVLLRTEMISSQGLKESVIQEFSRRVIDYYFRVALLENVEAQEKAIHQTALRYGSNSRVINKIVSAAVLAQTKNLKTENTERLKNQAA